MDRHRRDSDLRVGGLKLSARFTLTMSLALALVMSVAGFLLYTTTSTIAQAQQEKTALDAVQILAEMIRWEKVHGPNSFAQQSETLAMDFEGVHVRRFEVAFGENSKPGYLYQFTDIDGKSTDLVVPQRLAQTGEGLLGLIIGITLAVIVAGALVAYMVGSATARPLEQIVEDIRQISRGDLRHRTRVSAGGEIAMLARSVDRMAGNLDDAQEAQLELSVREREFEVAGEVREALIPVTTPLVPSYDLGAAHVESQKPGGDFHDYIEYGDGRIGLLVCSVSGQGIPGAMIGAIARSYLRVELASQLDLATAFKRVNLQLAQDVKRGIFVTAIYLLVDPRDGMAQVACAGHKLPLIRYTAADGKIRLVHPEGIALGFDKGPVFDRALEIQTVPLEAGDRLLISNTGPVAVKNPDEDELGEKGFYRMVLKYSAQATPRLLKSLRQSLEQYADGEPFPNDISIVTIAREA